MNRDPRLSTTPTATEVAALIRALPPCLESWRAVAGALESSIASANAEDFSGAFVKATELATDLWTALEDSTVDTESPRAHAKALEWVPDMPGTL